nr:UPF0236 family protein [Archaeoglobus neptunius]
MGRVLEEIDCLLVSSMQKGYGKNEYHKHQKERRTILTQLGKTTFKVSRVKDKSTGRTFCPLYNLIEFDGKRLYQPDIAAIAIYYALSMSHRDSRQRLERMTESPSHPTILFKSGLLREFLKMIEITGLKYLHLRFHSA